MQCRAERKRVRGLRKRRHIVIQRSLRYQELRAEQTIWRSVDVVEVRSKSTTRACSPSYRALRLQRILGLQPQRASLTTFAIACHCMQLDQLSDTFGYASSAFVTVFLPLVFRRRRVSHGLTHSGCNPSDSSSNATNGRRMLSFYMLPLCLYTFHLSVRSIKNQCTSIQTTGRK